MITKKKYRFSIFLLIFIFFHFNNSFLTIKVDISDKDNFWTYFDNLGKFVPTLLLLELLYKGLKPIWPKLFNKNLKDKIKSNKIFKINNHNEKYLELLIKHNLIIKNLESVKSYIQTFFNNHYQEDIKLIKNRYNSGINVIVEKSPYKIMEEELDEFLFIQSLAHKLNKKNIYYIELPVEEKKFDSFFDLLEKKLKNENAFYVIDKKTILNYFIDDAKNVIRTKFLLQIQYIFSYYKKSILYIQSSLYDNIDTLFSKESINYFEYLGINSLDKINIIKILLELYEIKIIDINEDKLQKINMDNFSIFNIIQLIKYLIKSDKKNITQQIIQNIIKKINDNFQNNTEIKNDKIQFIKNFSFDNIIGYESAKKELCKIIKIIKKKITKKLPGLVLYGPSGTGKTQLVKGIANELNIPVISFNAGEIISKYPGESEKNITEMFNLAKKESPCILFIDEAESMFQKKSRYSDDIIMNYFLSILDGINELEGIFIIIATNNLDDIDPRILRPGRIGRKIFISLPDENDREKLLSYYSLLYGIQFANDVNLEIIINQMNGLSCADIKYLFEYISDEYDILDNQNCDKGNIVINHQEFVCFYKSFLRQTNSNESKFKYYNNNEFADIGGYEDIKEELQEVANELKKQYTLKTKLEGIIFTGSPGVGKTQFSKALAEMTGVPMIIIEPKDIFSIWVGEAETKVYQLFELIRKNSPCIVFMDEIENILSERGLYDGRNQSGDMVTNLFLQYMDGIEELKGVLFIGATNNIDKVDSAIRRPGRMSHVINIDLPSISDCKAIIDMYLKKENLILEENITINYLSERIFEFSPVEIKKFVLIMKKIMEKENKESIDSDIVAEAYQQITLGKKNLKIKQSHESRLNTAYHEASHGLLQYICYRQNESPYEFDFLTITPRNNALGIAFMKPEGEYTEKTKEKLYGYIAIALAGKAGEKVFSNIVTSGATNDLELAFEMAKNMILKYGMGEKLIYKNEKEWREEINIKLEKQYAKLLTFLNEHKILIEEIVKKVFEKNILYSEDMKNIVLAYEKKYNKKVYFSVLA